MAVLYALLVLVLGTLPTTQKIKSELGTAVLNTPTLPFKCGSTTTGLAFSSTTVLVTTTELASSLPWKEMLHSLFTKVACTTGILPTSMLATASLTRSLPSRFDLSSLIRSRRDISVPISAKVL